VAELLLSIVAPTVTALLIITLCCAAERTR